MNLQQRGDLKGGRLFSETIGCICHRENCVKEIFTWQCVLRKLFLHKTLVEPAWLRDSFPRRDWVRSTRHPSWNFGKRDQTSGPWQVRRASRLIWQSIVHQQHPQCIPSHLTKTAQKKLILITIRNSFWGVFQLVPSNQLNKGKIFLFLIYFYGIVVQFSEKQFLLALIGIVLFHVDL